jgi:hypothetical protein
VNARVFINAVLLFVVSVALAGCRASSVSGPTLPHFRCYRVNEKGPGQTVKLKDQFFGKDENGPGPVEGPVRDYRYLCTPVEKTIVKGNPLPTKGPLDHLACYFVTGPRPDKDAVIDNQLDGRFLELQEGELLCVPTTKTEVRKHVPHEDHE